MQHRIEALPDELLHWLLPSRLLRVGRARRSRPGSSSGRRRRGRSACRRSATGSTPTSSTALPSLPTTTTVEVFERRGGMCRDFAHLGVTFCRALGIPARYVFGYMPDIGIPGPYPPMDFHAWFEVWLGDELVDVRRALQHPAHRAACRSAAAATRSTSRWSRPTALQPAAHDGVGGRGVRRAELTERRSSPRWTHD